MSLRTPLARVLGLGSAREGTRHWWAQRLTALALVPLVLWFVISVIGLIGAGRGAVLDWIEQPVVAGLMVLLIGAVFHHGQLGVQVVIEDYVHNEAAKLVLIIFVKFAAVVLAVSGILAVLAIAFGA